MFSKPVPDPNGVVFLGGVRKAISLQSQDYFFLIPSSANLEYFDPLVA